METKSERRQSQGRFLLLGVATWRQHFDLDPESVGHFLPNFGQIVRLSVPVRLRQHRHHDFAMIIQTAECKQTLIELIGDAPSDSRIGMSQRQQNLKSPDVRETEVEEAR